MTFHYKKGQAIFLEGDRKTGLYFIKKGKLKCSKKARNGQEIILKLATLGDALGTSILTSDKLNYEFSTTCMDDAVLCYVPYQIAKEQLDNNLHVFKAISQMYHKELAHFCSVIVNINTKSVRERVATCILELYALFGTDTAGYIDISITREEVANMSATTTESAIRYISEFKNENLIKIDKKKIQILSLTKLQKVAGQAIKQDVGALK